MFVIFQFSFKQLSPSKQIACVYFSFMNMNASFFFGGGGFRRNQEHVFAAACNFTLFQIMSASISSFTNCRTMIAD